MGKYDDITPDQLRSRLLHLATLIGRLDERGHLLERAPALLRLFGEMRRMIFAYEVRGTRNLAGTGPTELRGRAEEDASPDSLRVVEEALARERELQDELRDRLFPGEGNS